MTQTWYQNGLRFQCTRCGNCCTGAPGTVRVTDREIEALARRLDLEDHQFRRLYTRPLMDGANSLKEKKQGDCVFWESEKGCTVYPDRPRQCRTWPFWTAVVESQESWQEEAMDCPGMNQGPKFTAEQIHRSCTDDGTSASWPREPSSSTSR
ncbi:MAG: YkgJ family cysteine cluster protein [Deltaproteobacteria bacterium]|nr:YkgJ family cysteine cluster protein [Deltaproteobacteria bacterium]